MKRPKTAPIAPATNPTAETSFPFAASAIVGDEVADLVLDALVEVAPPTTVVLYTVDCGMTVDTVPETYVEKLVLALTMVPFELDTTEMGGTTVALVGIPVTLFVVPEEEEDAVLGK